jgi:hypothetical protein
MTVHSGFKQVVQAGLSVLFARVRYLSIYGVVDCQYWTSIDVDCISGEDYIVDWRDVSGEAMPIGRFCMLWKPVIPGYPWENGSLGHLHCYAMLPSLLARKAISCP